MNTNFTHPEHEQKAKDHYLEKKDSIKSLIERIELKLASNWNELSWRKVSGVDDAEHHILLALHSLDGLTEQEKQDNHI